MNPQTSPFKSASLPSDAFARISVRYSKDGLDYRGVVLSCAAQKMTMRFKSGRMIDDLDASLALCRQFNWRPELTQSVIRYVPIRDLHERGLVAIEFDDQPQGVPD